MSAGTEKPQFSFAYGHKIESRNPFKYFIMTKLIVSKRLLEILAFLFS